MDSGARGAALSFAQKGLGDELLAWENEADLVLNEFGCDNIDMVAPLSSILAEPPLAAVDKVIEKKGAPGRWTKKIRSIFTAPKKYGAKISKVELFALADAFGDWRSTQKKFFEEGVFDQLCAAQQ